jgi:hypothetical protein
MQAMASVAGPGPLCPLSPGRGKKPWPPAPPRTGPPAIGRPRKPQPRAVVSVWTAGLLALLLPACCLPGDCLASTRDPGQGRGELPPHARRAREPRAGAATEGEECQGRETDFLSNTVFGMDYDGNASTTVSGRTCQAWSAATPHEHSWTAVGDHNYCRVVSPDDNSAGVWCYTTDPAVRYEYCPVPECDTGNVLPPY